MIKNDSVAAIRSEGLVGDKYVEITFGSDSAPKVKNGDLIQGEQPLEFSDLMKKTNGLLDSAGGAMQNIASTSEDLKSISSKINQGTGTMGALINDKSVYQRINAGAAAMQEDMEALKHNFLLRGFFNKRGYEDSADLTKHEIPQLPAAAVSKTFTYEAAKLFDKPDTAKLKSAKALNEAGKFLETNAFGLAVVSRVHGHEGRYGKESAADRSESDGGSRLPGAKFQVGGHTDQDYRPGKIRGRKCTRRRRRDSGIPGRHESTEHGTGPIVETLARRTASSGKVRVGWTVTNIIGSSRGGG